MFSLLDNVPILVVAILSIPGNITDRPTLY